MVRGWVGGWMGEIEQFMWVGMDWVGVGGGPPASLRGLVRGEICDGVVEGGQSPASLRGPVGPRLPLPPPASPGGGGGGGQ